MPEPGRQNPRKTEHEFRPQRQNAGEDALPSNQHDRSTGEPDRQKRRTRTKKRAIKTRWQRVEKNLGLLLTVLLALAPIYGAWDSGSVNTWAQWLLSCWLLVGLVLSIPLVITSGQTNRLRYLAAFLLVLAVWGISFAQTVTWPIWIQSLLSPGAVDAYSQWIPDSARVEASESSQATLALLASAPTPASIDAGLTRHALSLPAMALATALLASIVLRTRKTIVLYLLVTSLAGGFFAYTGLVDAVRPNAVGYDSENLITSETAANPFGPFVNRNNAAGYLNLCLACCVGLLVYVVLKRRASNKIDERYAIIPEQWWQRPLFAIQMHLREMDTRAVAVLAIISLIVTGIAISGSRGGFLGIIGGTIATSLLTGKREAGFGKSFGIIAVAIGSLLLLGLVGMVESVSERLETIWFTEGDYDGRLDHWSDGLRAAWAYFPGGSGLGTYRYAYLPHQELGSGSWYLNADGMHVEWLVEGGIWLPLIAITFLMLVVVELIALAKLKKAPQVTALIAAGWFALASMLVSQAFDFGITLPPVLITFFTIVGAILGASDRFADKLDSKTPTLEDAKAMLGTASAPNKQSRINEAPAQPAKQKPRGRSASSNLPHPASTDTGSTDTGSTDRNTQDSAIQPTEHSQPKEQEAVDTQPEYAAPPSAASEQVAGFSTGVRDQFRSSNKRQPYSFMWTMLVFLMAMAAITYSAMANYWDAVIDQQPISAAAPPQVTPWQTSEQHLEITSQLLDTQNIDVPPPANFPAGLTPKMHQRFARVSGRRAIYHTLAKDEVVQPESVLMDHQSMEVLAAAREHALAALLKSPLSAEARFRLIQLDFISPAATQLTPELLEQLTVLRSRNPAVLADAAYMALLNPGPEYAAPLTRLAIQLNPGMTKRIWPVLTSAKQFEIARRGLPEDPSVYITVLESFPTMDPTWRRQLLTDSLEMVNETLAQNRDYAQHVVAGRIAVLIGNWQAAADSFEAAVDIDPTKPEIRFKWALALEQLGETEAFKQQLKRCILQDPQNATYQAKARLTER